MNRFTVAALNIYNGIIQGEAKELPTIQEFSQLSEQELDRIETLVQSLLKITKLDAGTIILEKSLENVSELARSNSPINEQKINKPPVTKVAVWWVNTNRTKVITHIMSVVPIDTPKNSHLTGTVFSFISPRLPSIDSPSHKWF